MDAEQRDLLLSMAFVYLSCGHERRALPLLLLVVQAIPADGDALRALAHAYTTTGHPERALAILDRLADLGRASDADRGAALLLRARALHALSRLDEARNCFREARRLADPPVPLPGPAADAAGTAELPA